MSNKKVIMSPEWSELMDKRRDEMARIQSMMRDWYGTVADTEMKLINDAVINAANKMKCSIYDVCFNMAPRICYENTYKDNKPTLDIKLEFVPIEKSYDKTVRKENKPTLCWSREANALLNDGTMPREDLMYVTHDRLILVEKDDCTVYSIPLEDLKKLPKKDGYGSQVDTE